MILNPYNEMVPLESPCYEIKKKIDELLNPNRESEADKRQDKSIEKIQKILRLLDSTKANKANVNKAIEDLIVSIYENFYTKQESDELFFRPKLFVESLPEEGKENILYVLEVTNENDEKFYQHFVFIDGDYYFLGTTDTVSSVEFKELIDKVQAVEEEISEISGVTSGCVSYEEFESGMTAIYETLDELSENIEEAFSMVESDISGITSDISGITSDIADIVEHQTEVDKVIENIKEFLENTVSPAECSIIFSRIGVIEDMIEDLATKGLPVTTPSGNITSSSDLLIGGNITDSSKITAPSITVRNAVVSDNARVSLNADDNVFVDRMDFEGDFGRRQGGNTVISVNGYKNVSIKHMNFSTPKTGTTYNALEIGLSKEPKNILIENCVFENKFENIPIIIYGVQNDAVININNVEFGRLSNCIRFSNSTNATGVTFNITNCTCRQWNMDDDWSGMMLFEDYTSPASGVVENNLFAPEKVKINISNFKYQDEALEMPADIAEICGTRDYATQVFYIWNDKEGFVPYNATRYPKIAIF